MLKSFLAVSAAAVLLTSSALASLPMRTFYVSQNGSNDNNGRELATAFRDFTPTDTMRCGPDSSFTVLVSGPATGQWTYNRPNPDSAPTVGGVRIYQFNGDASKPTASVVLITDLCPGVGYGCAHMAQPYVTWRGFSLSRDLDISNHDRTTNRDSLVNCHVLGDLYMNAPAKGQGDYSVVQGCTLDNAFKWGATTNDERVKGNVVDGNTMLNIFSWPSGSAALGIAYADSITFTRNRVHTYCPGCGREATAYFTKSNYLTTKYNHFFITNTNVSGCNNRLFYLRDSLQNWTSTSDTIEVNTDGEGYVLSTGSGHVGEELSTNHFTFDSLSVMTNKGVILDGQAGWRYLTIKNSVLVQPHGPVQGVPGRVCNGCLFDHNTIASMPDSLEPTGTAGVLNLTNRLQGDTTKVTNNIIFSFAPAQQYSRSIASGNHGWAYTAQPDSNPGLLVSNWNLVYHKPYRVTPGDMSVGYLDTTWKASRPGVATSDKGYSTKTGRDSLSLYGDPVFFSAGGDSTFLNFCPSLGLGSWAIGRAKDGADIGARPSAQPVCNPSTFALTVAGDAGAAASDTISIYNTGAADLILSNLATSSATGLVASLDETTVPVGQAAHLGLTTTIPATNTTLYCTFTTNDPTLPYVIIAVYINTNVVKQPNQPAPGRRPGPTEQ